MTKRASRAELAVQHFTIVFRRGEVKPPIGIWWSLVLGHWAFAAATTICGNTRMRHLTPPPALALDASQVVR